MARKKNSVRSDGRIAVQIYIGKDENGKRKYKTVYGSTQKEADAKAEEIRIRLHKGLDMTHDADTFAQWRDRWLKMKLLDVGASQEASIRSQLKHLDPLESIPIKDVKTYHMQDIILELSKRNPNTGKPTAKKTLTDIRNTARSICQYAVEQRIIEYNPADAVRIPKNAPKSERRALTADEVKMITEFRHRMQPAAMIMLYAGLRRGELIPLLWSDIDLNAGTISVTKAVDLKADEEDKLKAPKTEAGYRTVYMPSILTDYLREYKNTMQVHNVLVCHTVHNRMYTATSWKTSWHSYLLDLDVVYGKIPQKKTKYSKQFHGITMDNITPHMLRHTAATMMAEAGMDPATVQLQMGHEDVRTTLGVYTHITDQHQKEEIEKLNEKLCKSDASKDLAKTVDI